MNLRWHLPPQEGYLLRHEKPHLEYWRHACGCAVLMSFAGFAVAQTPPPAVRPPPTTAPGADPRPPPSPEQISYLFGLIFGAQLHNTGITAEAIVSDAVVRGLKDGLQGKQPSPADQQQLQVYARVSGRRHGGAQCQRPRRNSWRKTPS